MTLFQQNKMERFDWKKTIKFNMVLLNILGLWPSGNTSYGCNFYTFYEVFVTIFIQIGHISFQTINMFSSLDDLEVVTGTIFVSLMEMLGLLKSYCLIKNIGMLKNLMITINSDMFQPKSVDQRDLVQPNLKTWKTVVFTFWFLSIGWLIFYMFYPVFDRSVREFRLPFFAWYPYNTRKSPQYELTYLHQCLGISYLTMVNINVDTLIAALNMYIGAQFDILCDDLRNLRKRENAEIMLLKCVNHHREILKFAAYANRFYNWLIFLEFAVGGISIGLSMFQLTVVVPFSGEFYSFLTYSNCISLQVFMYCWFGNEVEVKSSKLSYAMFESDWTSLSPEVKKKLMFFLLKVHEPLKMSAFGLFYLSLDTFTRILRTAWSYFALLRQVNTPK